MELLIQHYRSGPKMLFWGFYLIEVVEIIEAVAYLQLLDSEFKHQYVFGGLTGRKLECGGGLLVVFFKQKCF